MAQGETIRPELGVTEEVLAGDVIDEDETIEVDIFDILRTVSDALRELFERVERLEARPQFSATIKKR